MNNQPIEQTVHINAPPETVFPYFTDPALLTQWIGTHADLQPQPGGLFALDFEETCVRGTYTDVDPPQRIVFTWGVIGRPALPPGSSTVEVTLTPKAGGTLVRLLHTHLPKSQSDTHATGWASMLAQLKDLLV